MEELKIADKLYSSTDITWSIFILILTKGTPQLVSYGVSFVNIISDAYFVSVIVVPYIKTCYAGPCYNGTQLYIVTIIKDEQRYQVNGQDAVNNSNYDNSNDNQDHKSCPYQH